MTTELHMADMTDVFSSLPWHDSELLGWNVGYGNDDEAIVTFQVGFCKSEIVTGRAEVQFHDCRGFYTNVDLLAKRLCSDQIASGYSERAEKLAAAFVKELSDRFDLYPGESMNGLYVFRLKLIHPGGELVVIARSFSLSQVIP
jgi:hypothetical protein